jgi:protein TonB
MKLLAVPVVLFLTVFVAGQSQPKSAEPPASTASDQTDRKDPPATSAKAPVTRMRVSAGVTTGMLLKKVEPVYPLQAKDAHIQGTVILHAIIDKQGNISSLTLVTGSQELISSATDAVRQWKYRPYLLKGEPIELDTTIEVRYQLTR